MSQPEHVTYPMPRPLDDPRFTWGLAMDVADVLEKHGYPNIRTSGHNLVSLNQALFSFLYGPPDADVNRTLLAERYPEAIGIAPAPPVIPGPPPPTDTGFGYSRPAESAARTPVPDTVMVHTRTSRGEDVDVETHPEMFSMGRAVYAG